MKQTISKFFLFAAKKSLLVSIVLLFPHLAQSQDAIAHRFSFSVAAGLGYNRFPGYFWAADLPYIPGVTHGLSTTGLGNSPKIMQVFEADFQFKLNDNRYIGLTFSQHNSRDALNIARPSLSNRVIFSFENYKHEFTYQHFGVEFGQEVVPRLHFGVGLSYFIEQTNRMDVLVGNDGPPIVTLISWEQRLDQLALSASLAYYFPVNYYFQIGIRTKGFLTLYGFTALTLTPVLRFSF
ncbi:MAG TPA: hypothetical protein DCM62_07805 [Bacteroidales bacterium]|nr:hypothetical protein [Bacteroidales bacterium]